MAKKKKSTRAPMSDEQKAKMKAGREAAALKKANAPVVPQPPADMSQVAPVEELEKQQLTGVETKSNSPFANMSAEDKDLMMLNLMSKMADMMDNNKGFKVTDENAGAAIDEVSKNTYYGGQPHAQVGANGVTGQVFKYPVEPEYYPNPRERLYDIPFLKRYNLRDNYIITWGVEGVEYEKNGVAFAEPRFICHLYRRIYDDENNDTGTAALISRTFLHEDRLVALTTANKLGITDQFADEREIMDEIRFIRVRDWLIALFTPYKFQAFKKKPRMMVIAGKQVEVHDTEQILDQDSADSKASAVQSQTGR